MSTQALATVTEILEDDDAIDADEVARLIGVGRKAVYEAAGRKEIPHRRVGRRFLFSRTAIKTWLACRTGSWRR
jgi:excisionase family DNA binding protein